MTQDNGRKRQGKHGKGRKSGDRFVTVLLMLVAALAVILVILAAVTIRRGSQNSSPEQSRTEQTDLGKSGHESDSAEEDREADSETGAEQETKEQETAEQETKGDITVVREETEALTEPETDAQSGKETEPETETETEAETETETEEPLTVAIDPGHQGSWVDMSEQEPNAPGSSEMKAKATTGTQGQYSGVPEYELNLQISLLLRTELEARGYRVILTREDNDTAISNAERAVKAYEEGGDIYVRIHANGSDDSSIQGALAMVPSPDNPYVGDLAEDSYLLADCILNAYCETASFSSQGIQYYDNMTGINWSRLPVMILEMGYMTNEQDDLRMNDPEIQPLMAQGIADGIDRYFEAKGMKKNSADSGEGTEHDGSSDEAAAAEKTELLNLLVERIQEEYAGPSQDLGEEWAVSIQDLPTGAQTDLNGSVSMASASVMKVFIMAAVYERFFDPENDTFSEQEETIRPLLSDMITVSSNEASNQLIDLLGDGDGVRGLEAVNEYCEAHGYDSTSMGRKFLESDPAGDNWTSANDCRDLLASIYSGTCVSETASKEMYDLLKQQTRTGKIPAGITDASAVTANKTGELAGDYGQYVENDIAIVDNGTSAYVLCVLSGNLTDNAAAVEKTAQISAIVYESLGR